MNVLRQNRRDRDYKRLCTQLRRECIEHENAARYAYTKAVKKADRDFEEATKEHRRRMNAAKLEADAAFEKARDEANKAMVAKHNSLRRLLVLR